LIGILTGEGWSASVLDPGNMKKLCEEDAKELFKKETDKLKLNQREINFTSHYNQSLKNCFMMIKISTDLTIPEPPATENLSFDFYDVGESSKIGSFLVQRDRKSKIESILYCHVSKQECHSLVEWQKLVKSFMEE
jgi:hypothetical protein